MKKKVLQILSYILVAVVACSATLLISGNWQQINPESKLTQLAALLDKYYVDDLDMDALEDAAANAMVEALPDRWSYYISADEYAAYEENKNNAYVGVGITVQTNADGSGLVITKVTEGGGAADAGLAPGDVIVAWGDAAIDRATDLAGRTLVPDAPVAVLRKQKRTIL